MDEEKIRADERARLLEETRKWAARMGIKEIDVPALVVLFIDTSPTTSADTEWAQKAWEEMNK